MNTLQLHRIGNRNHRFAHMFGGVYALNTLPCQKLTKETLFVVNLDPDYLPGKKWITLYINPEKKIGYYFDSEGRTPTDSVFSQFFRMNGVEADYNRSHLQDFFTNVSGEYCIFACEHFASGGSLAELEEKLRYGGSRADYWVIKHMERKYGAMYFDDGAYVNYKVQYDQQYRFVGLNYDYKQIMSEDQAELMFRQLETEIEYLEGDYAKVKVAGRRFPIPRKHAAYGEVGTSYAFSGMTLEAKPWTPTLLEIKEQVEKVVECKYNFVLVNRYDDGNQSIAFHADDERELDPESPIAAVSLGAVRPFIFKSVKRPFESKTLKLESGSLLVMKPPTNQKYKHSLPKRKNITKPRISLTFRRILPERVEDDEN